MERLLENPFAVKALFSLALAIVVIVLAKIAISIANKREKRISEAPTVIKYIAIAFFGVCLVFIWLEGLGPILTALTIVAAALTIVAKEMIINFLGSFVIFWRQLFAIGDRIQIGDHTGDVIDKGLLYFTLLEVGRSSNTGHSTGRLIKVPNALTLTTPIINATRGAGYIWNEITFSITRESDWQQGKDCLLTIVDAFIKWKSIDLEKIKTKFERNRIYFTKLTPKVYVSVDTHGTQLTLRYICNSRMTRESEDYITIEFLQCLKSKDIELVSQ
ncbi:mechanosensitive ion channel domain-containing protein [uncultured Pseudodesulfovibrio sp.]|uniref:mechanosensitive ion channel family protein n=1 Tax=uncultured Pseudodesulfovibrio sp. TaxID=2035858 RepID=UPI0029C89FE3|nr:mechanosensitive ion channel domain-containing protein [uncultured Pseudodesulfovibrio sp.]